MEKALRECMAVALKDGGVAASGFDYINAHRTSTKYGDELEVLL